MTQATGTPQREQTLSDVVRVLVATLVELGATNVLRARLAALRQTAHDNANSDGVAILDGLIDELSPPPKTPKPSFRIV